MNQSASIESYRYPKEKLLTQITRAVAWLLWALIGVFLVAFTLATNGALFFGIVFALILIVLIRLILTWRVLTRSVKLSAQRFPNLSSIVKKWEIDMADPYKADLFLCFDNNPKAYLLPALKRPVIIITSSAIDSLTLSGNLDELEFILSHYLAKAKMLEDYEWLLFMPLYLSFPLILLPLWLNRLRVISADQVAVNFTKNIPTASLAIKNITLGPNIAPRLDSEDHTALNEWPEDKRLLTILELFSPIPNLAQRLSFLNNIQI